MALLNFITPNFIVSNLQESVSFYVEKLGFEVWHLVPEEAPFFAMVGRENISVMMKEIGPDAAPIPNSGHHPWANWDAYINTSDPDVLYDEFLSRGVTFRQPLKVNDDGIWGFEVRDVNGYVLFFGKPNL